MPPRVVQLAGNQAENRKHFHVVKQLFVFIFTASRTTAVEFFAVNVAQALKIILAPYVLIVTMVVVDFAVIAFTNAIACSHLRLPLQLEWAAHVKCLCGLACLQHA